MSSPICSRLLRQATRRTSQWTSVRTTSRAYHLQSSPLSTVRTAALLHRSTARSFATSVRASAGLMPDTSDPQPPPQVEEETTVFQPAELNEEEYHVLADEYMEAVHEQAEAVQESRQDVDVEYSAGVLSVTMPPAGTYVVNKQPPNKQIWLSSPVTGPKRFDWVLHGEGMHQKEGGGVGDWIYLRDGSSLTDLLRTELGITVDVHGHEKVMKQSVDPTE